MVILIIKNISETIQINLNSNIRNKKNLINNFYFKNDEEILSKKIRIDLVDIEKGKKMWYYNSNNKLTRWCRVLLATTVEELKGALGDDFIS